MLACVSPFSIISSTYGASTLRGVERQNGAHEMARGRPKLRSNHQRSHRRGPFLLVPHR
jgi:hypothetical protein